MVQARRWKAAALALAGMAGGLTVVLPPPLSVHAAVPTPGIITTYAGGGLGVGKATTIGQNTGALAIFGTTLYIGDQTNRVVRGVDISSSNETIVAGNGSLGSSGDGGQATAAAIGQTWSLALNSSGDLYIASVTTYKNDPGNLIRKVDHSTGTITTVAGGAGSFADNVAATATSISGVAGMAFDSSGNLLIADFFNNRVRRIDHTTNVITTVAGTGNNVYQGDGIPATSANITFPGSVAVDSSDNILITSYDARLLKVDHSSGLISTIAGFGQSYSASGCSTGAATGPMPGGGGLTLGGSGNPMFVGYNCVTKIVSGNYSVVAGNGSLGYSGDGGPATAAAVGIPVNAVSDSSGNVYISQGTNNVVRRVDHATKVITTFAGTGQTCGYSGDGGQATAATMCFPSEVALDSAGDLFVSDSTFNTVRKISPGGVITAVAGNGTRGFSGDGGPATSAAMAGPAGLVVDGSGDLFISDGGNNRVRKVDHTSGFISTIAGNGIAGNTGDGGAAINAEISSPAGLVVDALGDLFIADGSIRKVTPGGTITTTWSSINSQYGASSLAIDANANLYGGSFAGVFELSSGTTFTVLTTTMSDGVAIGPQGQVVIIRHSTNQLFVIGSNGLVPLAGINYPGFSGDGGPATAAWLNFPTGLAIDPTGDIFIADAGNGRVRRVQAYTAPSAPIGLHASVNGLQANVTWAPPANDGGLPMVEYDVTRHNSSLMSTTTVTGAPAPTSTTFSGLHYHSTYTFTATASNGWAVSPSSTASAPVTPTIPNGDITTYAGTAATGNASAIGQAPYSLALELPQVFIGDGGSPLVRTLDGNSLQETVLAGNDSYGYGGDGGSAQSAALQGAGAVAECGPAGPVYIADSANYRIRVVNGGTISNFAGDGVPGDSGNGGPATQAQIGSVLGLACLVPAINSPVLYFTDATNGLVRAVDSNGNISTPWNFFRYPTGIFAIDAHTLLVADSGANVIWWVNDQLGVCFLAGLGPAGYGCSGGPAERTVLHDPRGISWDNGNLYFADEGSNTIRMVDASGNISTVAGTGVAGFSGDGGAPTSAQLNHPTDVRWTTSGGKGTLYIADFLNFRVRVAQLDMNIIQTIAGNGAPSLAGDGFDAPSAGMGLPYGIAVDGANNEYIVDNQDNVIRKNDANGVITTVAGDATHPPGFTGDNGAATSASLNDPRGVAVDTSGDIFVSDTGNNRVRRVDHTTGTITTFAGNGVAGFAGDGGPAKSAEINAPRGLTFDAAGNLYIADTANNRVRKVDLTGHISTVAGNGTAGFSGDGGSATAAKLWGPRGIAFNALGDMFISDSNNNRIRMVDHTSQKISTFAGNGVAGAAGDDFPATNAALNFPFGLAFDGAGNLYIADSGNSRLRMISTTGKISTVVGRCSYGFSGDGGSASEAELNLPYGVAVDGVGNVLIADFGNNRIRGARGLIVNRSGACQSAPATPGSRDTKPGPTGTPGTHLPDNGTRSSLALQVAGSSTHAYTVLPAARSSARRSAVPAHPGDAAPGDASPKRSVASKSVGGTPLHSASTRFHAPRPAVPAQLGAPIASDPYGALAWLVAAGAASFALLVHRLSHRRKQRRSQN
jgi:sugar lactone lactonase YvrE